MSFLSLEENVEWLEVVVHLLARVQSSKTLEDANDETFVCLPVLFLTSIILNEVLKVPSLAILHDNAVTDVDLLLVRAPDVARVLWTLFDLFLKRADEFDNVVTVHSVKS